jgi:hypothetical protein
MHADHVCTHQWLDLGVDAEPDARLGLRAGLVSERRVLVAVVVSAQQRVQLPIPCGDAHPGRVARAPPSLLLLQPPHVRRLRRPPVRRGRAFTTGRGWQRRLGRSNTQTHTPHTHTQTQTVSAHATTEETVGQRGQPSYKHAVGVNPDDFTNSDRQKQRMADTCASAAVRGDPTPESASAAVSCCSGASISRAFSLLRASANSSSLTFGGFSCIRAHTRTHRSLRYTADRPKDTGSVGERRGIQVRSSRARSRHHHGAP